jgi:vesicle transport protein SEC22
MDARTQLVEEIASLYCGLQQMSNSKLSTFIICLQAQVDSKDLPKQTLYIVQNTAALQVMYTFILHSELFHLHFYFSYLISGDIIYICISERSYPRKLAFTYLSDLSTEFSTTYPPQQVHSPSLRPYAFMEFDTFISRTKATYSDTRATQNLDKLNDELRDVTKVMTKNIEDLLYRGDSLEKMGEVSSRLRDDSRKYRKAAVRINWELLLKQYGPIGGLAFIIVFFLYWKFFW